ncbi:bifunctional riboflavin kinase/FAD synthetase [Gracilibacillus sp. YIM 98692]|uniref:bifunctional riboflavin kinase/FAD synthetase n=1 Tax=Gracilibacillus sp. YIM 98692 TaxID=2663532 RepID=UPI0013D229DF|nr:bifunctional riboflavin kinase/FAD synthetase [Gracilibacillus sp. YIM 98692]
MEVISISYPHSHNRDSLPSTVASIGFFDGIHKGHQKVIEEAVNVAARSGKESAVITFDPHPSVVLRKVSSSVQYITPIQEKKTLIENLGVDRLYIIEFNKSLSLLSPEDFIEHFIYELHVDHLIAGFDFSFGYKGTGNMDNIEKFARHPLTTTKIEKFDHDGEKISSTSIRKALIEGNILKVENLLGRPLTMKAKVIQGDKRGRTIGYPTANLQWEEPYLLPKIGVYAVEVKVGSEKYQGMANLGYNPTFTEGQQEAKMEVHLFDVNKDLYGKTLQVIWRQYIREEVKFSGVEELVAQLQQDEKDIRQFFSKNA